jgi:hypothetical protein
MKKILFPILVFGILLTMSNCDNDPVKEDYDINSGVYPYEVTDVTHTMDAFTALITVSWKNPTNKNFSHVKTALISESAIPNGIASYGSEEAYIDSMCTDQEPGVTSRHPFADILFDFIIIKCVDRYGNVSEGVRYNSWTL